MNTVIISVTNDIYSDQRIFRTASVFDELGFKVILVGRRKKNSLFNTTTNFKIIRFTLLFNKGFFFYFEYSIRLFLYLLFSKANIFFANDLDTLLPNYLANTIKRKKLIYDSHEYFTEVPELVNRKLIRRVWLIIEKYIFPKLKTVITVNTSIAKEYSKKYNNNIYVIRNIPNSVIFNKPITLPFDKQNKKIIIYTGALNIGRGIEHAIESMQFLNDCILVIVGDGDLTQQLKELTYNLKLNNKIYFVGKVNYTDIPNWCAIADVGISIEEPIGMNYYYALPNKLFNYIQAQIPVLVSNFPEMSEIVTSYNIGMVLIKHTPEQIANSLKTMLYDSTKRTLWLNNLKKAANELCWEKEKIKLISIVQNI